MNDDRRTELGSGRGALATALLLGTVAVVAVADFRGGLWPDVREAAAFTVGDLIDGSAPRRVDARLETHAPSMRAVRPYWNEASYTLFRETPSMVVAGRDDWLYYAGTLTACEEPASTERLEETIETLTVFRDMATRAGTRLVVLVIPAKWRLRPDGLRGPVPAGRAAIYRRARARLVAANFEAPDVLTAIREWQTEAGGPAIFARNDTHVTIAGFARLATDLAAPLVGVSPTDARARIAELPRVEKTFPGDLVEFLSIRPNSSLGRRLSRSETYHAPGPSADRPDCPIVVVGDSFTEQHGKILPRFVQAATGRPVDARYTGFGRSFDELPVEYTRVPELLLMVLSERRFGL